MFLLLTNQNIENKVEQEGGERKNFIEAIIAYTTSTRSTRFMFGQDFFFFTNKF